MKFVKKTEKIIQFIFNFQLSIIEDYELPKKIKTTNYKKARLEVSRALYNEVTSCFYINKLTLPSSA